MRHQRRRREIIDTARRMNALGLNRGTSGNISARVDGGLLITPSGIPYEECRPGNIVEMGMDGTSDDRRRPSSEWRFHREILAARPEVGAVVHAHSTFATTLACLGRGIPAFHYMIAAEKGIQLGPVTPGPDPAIEAIVSSWPVVMEDTRARKLGLPGDESLEAVIGEYLDGFGVG